MVVGFPVAYKLLTVPPTCTDGIQNQQESAPDRGGSCPLVDTRSLSPASVLWARAFRVRDGSYTATSYIQNPNDAAGVAKASYIFRLYDAKNILVAERRGETFIMPGGITPVIEGAIDVGYRIVAHTFFQFTGPLVWAHYSDASKVVHINHDPTQDIDTVPRINGTAENTSVATLLDVNIIAVVFDTAGNAFASSATHIDRMASGEKTAIVFTWPSSFPASVGRIDIIPLLPPKAEWKKVK